MVELDVHPSFDGKRFTLRGLFIDQAGAIAKAEDLAGAGREVRRYVHQAPSGVDLHHVAVRHLVEEQPRAHLPHERTPAWEATRIAIEMFRAIARAASRKGIAFRWYKELEEERLKACVESWHWGGTIEQVASDILSKTVQAHPFPNANHRTSLGIARVYLDAAGLTWPPYSFRGRGIDRFHRETRPFVHRSKYLLHAMRHQPILRIAHGAGYRQLSLSQGVTVDIQEADLGVHRDALKEKHRRECALVIRRLTSEAEEDLLDEPNPLGLRDFVGHVTG